MKHAARTVFGILILVFGQSASALDVRLSLLGCGFGAAGGGQVKRYPDYAFEGYLGEANVRLNDMFALSAGVFKGRWLVWTDNSESDQPLPSESYGYVSFLPVGMEYDFASLDRDYPKRTVGIYGEYSWLVSHRSLDQWKHSYEFGFRVTLFSPPEIWQLGDLRFDLGYSSTAGFLAIVHMNFLTASPTGQPKS
jgi:hypothetical protein